MPDQFHRIVVVGSSCCGKSTFAKRLAALLDIPHVELDALHCTKSALGTDND